MFTIYGKKDCSLCESAKTLISMQKYEYEYKELDKDYTLDELINILPIPPRTFPQIFNDGVYIGTFAELGKLFKKP